LRHTRDEKRNEKRKARENVLPYLVLVVELLRLEFVELFGCGNEN